MCEGRRKTRQAGFSVSLLLMMMVINILFLPLAGLREGALLSLPPSLPPYLLARFFSRTHFWLTLVPLSFPLLSRSPSSSSSSATRGRELREGRRRKYK